MHITDPIADMLTRIRNANNAKRDTVDIPASNMKKAIAQILLDEGYIKAFQLVDDGTQGVIHVTLKYNNPGKEKVISGLRRVSKPVKGGRVMKFSALVVVGDEKGKVGFGLCKAAEVPEAIRKGLEAAKKNMFTITLSGTTIPHEVIGEFGAGRVLMKPAAPGTGVIAGGAVRAVVEAAGIKDIRTKCLRSNNPNNVVGAAIEGLKSMRSAEQVAKIRGKSVDEIIG